jgi:thioesterase domain-containing protein
LVDLAVKAGRLPQSFTLADAERIAAVFKNTVHLQSNYQPQPWSGRSILLRATKRHHTSDPLPDWSPYLMHLRVNNVAASHYDLVTSALAPTVAALLRPYLK